MKVLLIHQYAGNKGDRAVLFAICRLLLNSVQNISITVSTSDRTLWEGSSLSTNNNITFIPSAWDYCDVPTNKKLYFSILSKIKKYTFTIMRELCLRRNLNVAKYFANPYFLKAANESDRIISVGGHHFTTLLSRDLVSSINFDSIVLYNIRKPMICFSQSMGDFEFYNIRNKTITERLLNNTKGIYLRDSASEEYLLKIGVTNKQIINKTYESVLSLCDTLPSRQDFNRQKKVGISIYITHYLGGNKNGLEEYICTFVTFCNYLTENGYDVIFIPMELKGTPPDDRPYIQLILDQVKNREKCLILDQDLESDKHIETVSQCNFFIGHKTHSVILALASATPLIAISYHQKTADFMTQFDLSQYCVSDASLNANVLMNLFRSLEENQESIHNKINSKLDYFVSKIKADVKNIMQ